MGIVLRWAIGGLTLLYYTIRLRSPGWLRPRSTSGNRWNVGALNILESQDSYSNYPPSWRILSLLFISLRYLALSEARQWPVSVSQKEANAFQGTRFWIVEWYQAASLLHENAASQEVLKPETAFNSNVTQAQRKPRKRRRGDATLVRRLVSKLTLCELSLRLINSLSACSFRLSWALSSETKDLAPEI